MLLCTTCLHSLLAHTCLHYYLLGLQYTVHVLFYCTFYLIFYAFYFLLKFFSYLYLDIFSCVCVAYNCTVHGADLTYILLLVIFCIIMYVTNKTNLESYYLSSHHVLLHNYTTCTFPLCLPSTDTTYVVNISSLPCAFPTESERRLALHYHTHKTVVTAHAMHFSVTRGPCQWRCIKIALEGIDSKRTGNIALLLKQILMNKEICYSRSWLEVINWLQL